MRKQQKGMTLIEILITLAIISILASLGYNGYKKFKIETYREEAKTALVQAHTWVERYLIENNISSISNIDLPKDFNTDNYDLTLEKINSTDDGLYKLVAQAKSNSTQNQDDPKCITLKLYQNGKRENSSCW